MKINEDFEPESNPNTIALNLKPSSIENLAPHRPLTLDNHYGMTFKPMMGMMSTYM